MFRFCYLIMQFKAMAIKILTIYYCLIKRAKGKNFELFEIHQEENCHTFKI